jgi:hypothetical protein
LYAEEVSIRGVIGRFVFALFVNAGVTLFAHQSKLQPLRLIFEFGEFSRFVFAHQKFLAYELANSAMALATSSVESLPPSPRRVRAAAATGHVLETNLARFQSEVIK